MNKETICAVVVTYNRKNLLIECLEGLRRQTRPVDAIYLIDNASTDGTPELLLEKGYIKELPPLNIVEPWEKEFEVENFVDHQSIKIHYVRMDENTGGAGGFYEGMKRAYEKGYDWFWLMDDDCCPTETCLEYLKNAFKNEVAGPLVINRYTQKPEWVKKKPLSKKIAVKSLSFNGFFINRLIVGRIGFPNKEMFIYGDDEEYSYRIRHFGYNLYLINNAILYHAKIEKDIKRTLVIFNKALLYHCEMEKKKLFYCIRNGLIIVFRYQDFSLLLKKLRESLSYLIFSNHRFMYMKTFSKALIDAFKFLKRKKTWS
jgi:GT2 family glycosyltransferase